MNSLERSLIQKAGYDNGWEVVVTDSPERVELASALHRGRARIESSPPGCRWIVNFQPEPLRRELERKMQDHFLTPDWFGVGNESELGAMLEQAARLARSLPDEPSRRFEKAVAVELSTIDPNTCGTEIGRLVRQRVGQDIYRQSLLDYWGGACAVTGIALPEILRASHAKPWAECKSDEERLNVFNGFLLVAHLDAMFDRHLMTFGDDGLANFSATITPKLRNELGLGSEVRLRWFRDEHQPFLAYHRQVFETAELSRS